MSLTDETESSTDCYFTSSDESRSTRRSSDVSGRVVPRLDLSKLNDRKNKGETKAVFCSPFQTKSKYAIHPPTPGFGQNGSYKAGNVEAKMREFEGSETDQLPVVLHAVTVEMLANDDEIVENNEELYRQNMDCEHMWYDNRVARLHKQQLRKDIKQREWYIQKSKEEIKQLQTKHEDNVEETKKVKRKNKQLRNGIEKLETDISELKEKEYMSYENMKDETMHTREEGLKIASENEIRLQTIGELKTHLSEWQNKNSSSASETQVKDGRKEHRVPCKLPPINRKVCEKRITVDDAKDLMDSRESVVKNNTTCAKLPKLRTREDQELKQRRPNVDDTKHMKQQRLENVCKNTYHIHEREEENTKFEHAILPPMTSNKRGIRKTELTDNCKRKDKMSNKKQPKQKQ